MIADVVLINRINPDNNIDEERRISFIIGNMNDGDTIDRLVSTISNFDGITGDDVLYKYDGVEINIKKSKIPKMVKSLIDNNIDIYSLYEVYDPQV